MLKLFRVKGEVRRNGEKKEIDAGKHTHADPARPAGGRSWRLRNRSHSDASSIFGFEQRWQVNLSDRARDGSHSGRFSNQLW